MPNLSGGPTRTRPELRISSYAVRDLGGQEYTGALECAPQTLETRLECPPSARLRPLPDHLRFPARPCLSVRPAGPRGRGRGGLRGPVRRRAGPLGRRPDQGGGARGQHPLRPGRHGRRHRGRGLLRVPRRRHPASGARALRARGGRADRPRSPGRLPAAPRHRGRVRPRLRRQLEPLSRGWPLLPTGPARPGRLDRGRDPARALRRPPGRRADHDLPRHLRDRPAHGREWSRDRGPGRDSPRRARLLLRPERDARDRWRRPGLPRDDEPACRHR